jgi:hypothetical protein
MFRPCADCGGERLFEQPHEVPGSCPDAPDGRCPEWLCTECGAAWPAMDIPAAAEHLVMPAVVGRVA